jgi:hypothetical protein
MKHEIKSNKEIRQIVFLEKLLHVRFGVGQVVGRHGGEQVVFDLEGDVTGENVHHETSRNIPCSVTCHIKKKKSLNMRGEERG